MSKTKERIRDSQLRYKQGLGQNFIYDETLLEELVRLSGVGPEDDVLEIGPGSGSMTKYLCQAAHHVLSLELDERLLPMIRAFLAPYPNFELHQGDAMTVAVCTENDHISEDVRLFREALSRDGELLGERMRLLAGLLKEMGY